MHGVGQRVNMMGGGRRIAAAMLFALLIVVALPAVGRAATIDVTTNSGGTGGTDCTLRDAISSANTGAVVGACTTGTMGPDIINLAVAGPYSLTVVDNGTDGPNGLPSVTSVITLMGNGETIQRTGATAFRLVHVAVGATLEVVDTILTNGNSTTSAARSATRGRRRSPTARSAATTRRQPAAGCSTTAAPSRPSIAAR